MSENPSAKPSRLTKMGEEFMREMFKPVEPDFADSHFLGSQLGGFRSAGNTRLSNALADHVLFGAPQDTAETMATSGMPANLGDSKRTIKITTSNNAF